MKAVTTCLQRTNKSIVIGVITYLLELALRTVYLESIVSEQPKNNALSIGNRALNVPVYSVYV